MNQMETLKERIEEEREKLNRLALGDDLRRLTARVSYWTGWSRNIWTGRVPEKRRNRKFPPKMYFFIFNIKSRTAVLRKRQK